MQGIKDVISTHNLLLKFRKEREQFENESQTEYVKGLRYGLELGIKFILEAKLEADNIPEHRQNLRFRWTASQFRHAIHLALRNFKRADRARGIRVLEEALEHGSVEHREEESGGLL